MNPTKTKLSYRGFNRWLSISIVLWVLGLAGCNALIDPYGLFASPKILGVNQLKPKQYGHVRMFKAADIIRQQPMVVLLGSSRVDIGLDPSHPRLTPFGATYNLGLLGANMQEVRQYFDHAIANQPDLQLAVMGLDFFMFNQYKANEVGFRAERLQQTHFIPRDIVDTILSIDATEASVETMSYNLRPFSLHLFYANGQRYTYNPPPLNRDRDFVLTTARLLEQQGYYQDYKLSEDYLAELQAVVATAAAKGIELKLFISPPHATLTESLRIKGLWPQYEAWKRAVAAIAPVWDFSGYNSITTEPFSPTMTHYEDSSHYSPVVGNLILDRILADEPNAPPSSVPDDFGLLLTPANVNRHSAQIEDERDRWLATQTEDLQLVYQPDGGRRH